MNKIKKDVRVHVKVGEQFLIDRVFHKALLKGEIFFYLKYDLV